LSYTPRPNASGDTLVLSRDAIRTNFEVLQSRFEDNHTDFSSGTGKHKFLQMPEQSSAPTTAVNEGGLYTKVGSTSTVTELFFRRENNGSEIQITGQGGVTPVILTGSVALTTSAADIVAVPANSWGNVWFSSQSARTKIQSGFFFSDATKAYAYSHQIKQNGSTSFQIYVSLINNPSALTIRGNTDSSSHNATYDYKIMYWIT
jgi:hypothetical protein